MDKIKMNCLHHTAGEQANPDLARRVIGSFDVERSCKVDPSVSKWQCFIDSEEQISSSSDNL